MALSQGSASAQLSAALVSSTAKAAALVAAGQAAAVSTTAVLLMKGVMKAMLMKKLRLAVGAVLVLVALGAVGFGYQAGGGSGVAQAAPPDKPQNELEALRKENELLRLNLLVVLEKVHTQEAELQAARGREVAFRERVIIDSKVVESATAYLSKATKAVYDVTDAAQEAEAAVKALREAKDKEGQRRATEALEKALEKLKQQSKPRHDPTTLER